MFKSFLTHPRVYHTKCNPLLKRPAHNWHGWNRGCCNVFRWSYLIGNIHPNAEECVVDFLDGTQLDPNSSFGKLASSLTRPPSIKLLARLLTITQFGISNLAFGFTSNWMEYFLTSIHGLWLWKNRRIGRDTKLYFSLLKAIHGIHIRTTMQKNKLPWRMSMECSLNKILVHNRPSSLKWISASSLASQWHGSVTMKLLMPLLMLMVILLGVRYNLTRLHNDGIRAQATGLDGIFFLQTVRMCAYVACLHGNVEHFHL